MGIVHSIPASSARCLQSENQLSVDRYLVSFKKYVTEHNVWDRVKDLTLVASTMSSEHCKQAYDAIDRDVTRAMLHAENECKRPAGKYAWSPKLWDAGLLARYWYLSLKDIERGKPASLATAALLVRLHELRFPLLTTRVSIAPLCALDGKQPSRPSS